MNKRQAKKQEKTQNRVPSQTTRWLNTINNNTNNNTSNNNSPTNAENTKLKRKLHKEKHKNLKYKNRIKTQLSKKNKNKSKNKKVNAPALQWNCAIRLGVLAQLNGLEKIMPNANSRSDVIKKLLKIGKQQIISECQRIRNNSDSKSSSIPAKISYKVHYADFLSKETPHAIKNMHKYNQNEVSNKKGSKSKTSSK